MAEPYYCTVSELRDHLSVSQAVLDDTHATSLIEDAEDVVDDMLGARTVDSDTGRKVVEADVDAWRFAKLKRATLRVAAMLYQQPKLLTTRRWETEEGPDFKVSGPLGSMFGSDVEMALNQSGLRRLFTTVGDDRGDKPPWYPLVYNDPDED